MLNIVANIFKNRRIIFEKLLTYGFVLENNMFVYKQKLANSGLILTVSISDPYQISAKIFDPNFGETYNLHIVEQACGSFVGKIREEYASVLRDIANKCSEIEVFKTNTAKALIKYIKNKYTNEPEYLWEKDAGNAVWRRKDTLKWYGIIMKIPANKLGKDSTDIIEIVDFRASTEVIRSSVDYKKYYPGWHMNKQHWITVILDESISFNEICAGIDNSYLLAKK